MSIYARKTNKVHNMHKYGFKIVFMLLYGFVTYLVIDKTQKNMQITFKL